jgi:hypothetical protein
MAKLKRQSRRTVRYGTSSSRGRATQVAKSLRRTVGRYAPAGLAGLSQDALRQWLDSVTAASANAYDKAMDAAYLKTQIGGGNHRMFDGGHDLAGAFDAAQGALPGDTFLQEVAGYAGGLWRDMSSVQGLPFVTWPKAQYDACATWVSQNIPLASKDWFYDLCSFDALELTGATLGILGAVFFLNAGDAQQVTEMLGAMSISAIADANPLSAVAVICIAVYAYAVKKHAIDTSGLMVGASMASMSLTVFAVLGLPFLIELAIALVATTLVRSYVLDSDRLRQMVAEQARTVWQQGPATARLHSLLRPKTQAAASNYGNKQ